MVARERSCFAERRELPWARPGRRTPSPHLLLPLQHFAVLLVLSSPLGPVATAAAAPIRPLALAEGERVRIVDQIGGASRAIAVIGDLVFIGEGPRLVVVRVEADGTPLEIGRSSVLPGVIDDVVVVADTAYVAIGSAGLIILDVSEPGDPIAVGLHEAASAVRSVCADATHAFLGLDPQDVEIVDVTDPSATITTASLPTPGTVNALALASGHVFAATDRGGLRLMDVRDRDEPFEVDAYLAIDTARDVQVSGPHALVAADVDGLRLLDVSNLFDGASEVAAVATASPALTVARAGDVAIVGEQSGRLGLFDLANPAAPRAAGALERGSEVTATRAAAGRAFAAYAGAGLEVVDVADADSPLSLGRRDSAGRVHAVTLLGSTAYAVADAGLVLVDLSDPGALRTISTYRPAAPAIAVGVGGGGSTAFVATEADALESVDLADASAPAHIATLALPHTPTDVCVAGSIAYVTTGAGGLHVIDVADPATATTVGTVATREWDWSVHVAGSVAYIAADDEGISVVDVSDPTTPNAIAAHPTLAGANDVVVDASIAYVAAGGAGMAVVDVGDPTAPFDRGSYPERFGRAVDVAGSHAYMATERGGLVVVDVASPDAPSAVATFPSRDSSRDVAATAALVLLADRAGGLFALEVVADGCSGSVCPCPDGPAPCDDGNGCTVDGCDENTGLCTSADLALACDDGDPCTRDDACEGGTCIGSLPNGLCCGDANGSGSITATDALFILRTAVGLGPGCPSSVCDVDGSGSITATDAQLVLRESTTAMGQLECPFLVASTSTTSGLPPTTSTSTR